MQERGLRGTSQLLSDYDRTAKSYDRVRFGSSGGRYTDYLEKRLIVRTLKKCSVLEVGTASGRFAVFLSRLGFDYTGFDLSRKMLGLASEKAIVEGRKLSLIQMDVQQMCLKSHFDNVLCVRTFHFIPKPLSALANMRNALVTGGRCLVTFETDNILRRLLLSMGLGKSEQRYYRVADVEDMLRRVGFRILETGAVLRVPITLMRRCPDKLLWILKYLNLIWPWPVQEYILAETA